MGWFIFEGRRIYYTETGSGAPLLLLHGNTASSRMFAQADEQYSASFRVICLDFLGGGQSDRLAELPADLWVYEAQQVIAFLREKQYENVSIIGSSGGALAAINAALEAPERIRCVIADSFAGEYAEQGFTELLLADRASAKADPAARGFYEYMHGADWEQVVDSDTAAILRHSREIGRYFRKPLETLRPEILLTGSRADRFLCSSSPRFFADVYGGMLQKIGHGSMVLFDGGDHPAMLTCFPAFYEVSMQFLRQNATEKG